MITINRTRVYSTNACKTWKKMIDIWPLSFKNLSATYQESALEAFAIFAFLQVIEGQVCAQGRSY